MEIYAFELSKNNWDCPITNQFRFSTDGQISDARTEVCLNYDDKYLHIRFDCFDDPFVDQNYMTTHNANLYEQEVFEVFINPGFEDSKVYLEIELNPNNALWVGRINNPTLGSETQTLDHMISHQDAEILHQATKSDNFWKGQLSIPWDLIGKNPLGQYRLNFYRIRLNKPQSNKNWISSSKNCDFICWSPTMAGAEPAFHRPLKFGKMQLI